MNPTALFKYGIGLEDVRAALASANANSPKGSIDSDDLHYQLYTNDQASHAADYKPLVVAYRNGAAVHLSDVADVADCVENLRNLGLSNGKPAVLVIVFRQPGANIIDTVDTMKAAVPQLMAAMPHDVDMLSPSTAPPPSAPACRHRTHVADRGRPRHPRGVRVPAQRPRHLDPRHRRPGLRHRHLRRRCTCSATAWTTCR